MLLDRQEYQKGLEKFKTATEQFYEKKISVAAYKAISGGFGSYAQRGGDKSMLRLRLTGGEITREHLQFIAESIEKYEINLIHTTTCQTIQLHNLAKETVYELVEEASRHGIYTAGGGGDYPRNIMCSPLSGVERGEWFDVLPYARKASEYLLKMLFQVKLPRKLKVCFSNGVDNETHATFRDLGFVAKPNHTFDVYAAGGLGPKPKMGVLAASDVSPANILYVIKTMLDVFTEYGDYENRAMSRSRFLQDKLGIDGFQKIFKETLEKNLSEGKLTIQEEVEPKSSARCRILDSVSAEEEFSHGSVLSENRADGSGTRLICQKQEGLFALSYHPVGGILKSSFVKILYDHIKDMDEARIRLSPTQGMYIINLHKEEAERLLKLTKEDQGTEFEKSTACIGADICQVGIGKSQELLKACVDRIRKEHFSNGTLPAIHISGCPSSCGAHQTAAIGLRGGKRMSDNGLMDAFALYMNGSEDRGQERFGEEVGNLFVQDIPQFFVELGREIEDTGLSYEKFRARYPERITRILQRFI